MECKAKVAERNMQGYFNTFIEVAQKINLNNFKFKPDKIFICCIQFLKYNYNLYPIFDLCL